MSFYRIREATASDAIVLTEALVDAANWDVNRQQPRVTVLADPMRRQYIASWPRPGDVGFIAEDAEGEPIGACWYRVFAADRPGFAAIPGVPELTLGVRPVWRAQGVGRSLLKATLAAAAAAGHSRMALSVDRGNFAQRLYISEGFVTVSSGDTAVVMVRNARNG